MAYDTLMQGEATLQSFERLSESQLKIYNRKTGMASISDEQESIESSMLKPIQPGIMIDDKQLLTSSQYDEIV